VTQKALVITADAVGDRMAGMAVRAYELARVLSRHADVVLAGVDSGTAPPGEVETVTYELRDPAPLRPLIGWADTVVTTPPWPLVAMWLRRSGARLIFDVYNPEPLEVLEYLTGRSWLVRHGVHALTLDRVLSAFHIGHHLICAGEKQRDLWIGTMLSQRLIDPARYDRDPSLRSAIETVPFGAPADPPRRAGAGIRARFPQIGRDDPIALWNGGIWNWFDAPTAIRAAGLVAERRPGFRLVFMGASTSASGQAATREAHSLAREVGLLDRVVFFNDSWVPYEERADWMLDADCALATYIEHLETRFAFRTRMLDCFWARLPVVCTRGDELADRVERQGLGETVPERDHEAVAGALGRVLDRGRDSYSGALEATARDLSWPQVARPVVEWVRSPLDTPRLGEGRVRRPGQALRDALASHGLALAHRAGFHPWPSP
jgi:glycosyltransferase involved in cell wall biosynthesis